jgi:3-oxoadipate enol-lactonase
MTARQTVPRPGFDISAQVTGQGAGAPAVLLSNSLGAGLGMWDHQRAVLERHYRVIGYDTRGHGQSGTPAGPYSFDDLVDDALAVLDHFGVAQADYIGLSLGGMTGLGLALRAPDRFRRMIVTAARADAPAPFVQSWDDRIAAIEKGGMAAIWQGTLDRWLTPAFAAAHPEAVARLAQDFGATTPAGYAGCAVALKGLDYLRHLGGVKVPMLFVSGAQDMGAPAAAMEAMAAATPGAKYLCIPDAAHIVNINAPDAFDAAMLDFLGV